ncbi:MAG: hypothetical protein HGB26_05765 [Desulfobulbaceae bacterium]|nr:hypothetical protein [Desulfobulbaceae bacterium]
MFVKHSRYLRFIILLIPLFLVFFGMKVPDFSRPQKPKPMRRAVLDKTPVKTVLQSIVKIDIDPCITSLPTIVFLATEEYFPEASPIHSPVHLLSRSPFPPRAPPASPTLA